MFQKLHKYFKRGTGDFVKEYSDTLYLKLNKFKSHLEKISKPLEKFILFEMQMIKIMDQQIVFLAITFLNNWGNLRRSQGKKLDVIKLRDSFKSFCETDVIIVSIKYCKGNFILHN